MQAISHVRANIPKLYAFWFFHHLIFAYVVERLFWAGRGITVQQVVFLEIFYSGVVLLLEVPTGALADRFSRKVMMVLSAVCTFGEFFTLIYAHSFPAFAGAIFSAAVAKALASGTSNALLYDSLAMTGETEHFEAVLGRINSLGRVAGAVAALAGAFIASRYSLVSTYWSSLVSTACSFLVALLLAEPRQRASAAQPPVWSYIRTAYSFLRRRRDVLRVVLHGVVISSTVVYIDEFWQIYLKEIRVAVAYFGPFSVGVSLVVCAGALLSLRLKHGGASGGHIYITLLLGCAGAVLAAGCMRSPLGILFLLLAYLISGIYDPLVSGYLHRQTASEHRATVESFQSLASRAITALVGLGFGWVASRSSVSVGYIFLGIMAACYVFSCLPAKKGFPGRW